MMRRSPFRPGPVALSAILLMSLTGCAREDAPAPVTYHGNAGVPPPAYAPPPYSAPLPVASRAAPPAHAPPRYAAPARPAPRPARPTPTEAVPPPEAPPQSHPDKVLVVDGDTIWSMSRRHGVPVRSIIDVNNLKAPYRLVSGSILVLPQVRQHTVRPGETLYSISRLYGVDTSTLVRLNHMEPPYNVKLDTVMVIPPPVEGGRAVAEARAPAPPPSGLRSPAQVPPAAVPPLPPDDKVAAAAAPMPTVKPDRAPPAVNLAPAPQAEPAALPPPLPGGKGFVWPVEGRVLGTFGEGPGGTHNDGINIAAPEGTPVVAAEAGVVAYTGNELRGYGNLVLIKHAGGWTTAYAHNEAVLVKRGDIVKRGQMIARVGATGAVGEPQLHFEMRRGTRALDPTAYLPATRATAVND